MYEKETTTPVVEDEDVLLPDGWGENDDIFDEGSWTGDKQVDAPASDPAQPTEETMGEQPAAPTTEPAAAPGEKAAAGQAPTTEPTQQQPNKFKFKARVDRQDLDVEMDESELPTMYQKAQATDRYRAKLDKQTPVMEELERVARSMGHDDPTAFLASVKDNLQRSEIRRLVGDGVHEEVAKDMVERRFTTAQQTSAAEEEPVPAKAPTRDFAAEARELVAARPDLAGKTLPREVVEACAVKGKPLIVAYAEYEVGQQKAEAERLRKENEVLRQNAAAAARAPVSGVTGGGATDTGPEDDFLKGFDSY